jgi:hypothetical protein
MWGRIGRIKEPDGKEAGGDHEDGKFDGFIEIKAPMVLESGDQWVDRSDWRGVVSRSGQTNLLPGYRWVQPLIVALPISCAIVTMRV